MELQTILFYGMTGAGKGTQAKLLVQDLKVRDAARETLYIETGDRFRTFMEMPFYTSFLTKETLAKGGLLPVFLPVWLWTDILVRNYTGKEHLILDGLARRVEEAPVLDSALRYFSREKPQVVVVNVVKEEVIARLEKRGRYDDNIDKVKVRLEWYEKNVVPTIEFFRKHTDYYTVHDIDGSKDVETVHTQVKKALFGE